MFCHYLAFAYHLIYHLNKYNMNILSCYTIQYTQYSKKTFLKLLLFEVACSAEVSLPVLIAGNKLLCSHRDTVCSSLATIQHRKVTHPAWKPCLSDAAHWGENERSPAALVAGFTAGSLQIVWTSWISFFSGSGNFDTTDRISSKHDVFSFNITSKILSGMHR